MTSSVCDICLSTKVNTALSRLQRKKSLLNFGNAIYLKVARQVYVKTQIELEIWANCSGNKK